MNEEIIEGTGISTRLLTALEEVEMAANKLRAAEVELTETIRFARMRDYTLREIADASGQSPETVRKWAGETG